MNTIAVALASYNQQFACMVCRAREATVHVLGGGEVCDRCAMHIPIEMLPRELVTTMFHNPKDGQR